MASIKYVLCCAFLIRVSSAGPLEDNSIEECNLPDDVKQEIKGYQPLVDEIVAKTLNGKFKGTTYAALSEFVDRFGARMTGTKNLEDAIDYMLDRSKGVFDVVKGEQVVVPHWIRGNESASMIKPRYQDLPLLALGTSVGTPIEGVTAEVIVVSSFDELDQNADKVKGKIVVYNQNFTTYGESVAYRGRGADAASKHGAIAALVRSVTPFSLRTPHTGMQSYSNKVPPIPVACITVEDANMLHRRYLRGENIVINLKMGAKTLGKATSRNTVVDITGTEKPDDIVLVSGHLDSWDVGEGAMDDGAGAIMSWNALKILRTMKLKPKRTLRAVLWTGEEFGYVGAISYLQRHKTQLKNYNFVMESDEGTFTPEGMIYSGMDYGACILEEIMQLFKPINATKLERSQEVGSDIMVFVGRGIPGASLLNKNEKYFYYHHSAADTLDVEDADTLDKCTAVWAAVSYIIADLSVDMPKKLNDD